MPEPTAATTCTSWGGRCGGVPGTLLGVPAPYVSPLSSHPASCWCTPWHAAGGDSATWGPFVHVGDPDRVLRSWFWPDLALAVTDKQGVSQQMEDCYLCLSLFFKQIKNKRNFTKNVCLIIV